MPRSADTPPGPDAIRRPEQIGPYRVESRIGSGAMGAVYGARDPQTGRMLAVKTLALSRDADSAAFDEARLRFEREAQAAQRLTHPDIVAILDSNEEQGLAWIAMEYLPGRDLTHYTAPGGLLPVTRVLRIAARVADALAYAHSRGVVHRDVKPANVMVDLDTDSVKVTDFGIARIVDTSRTRTGMVLGTPSFMSPEQMVGLRVDGRSDLYSLGVMLFQLLCGRLPHQADSMAALMRQIAQQPAPDLRSLRPQLPAELAELVARMLEKRPELRPADGRQLAQQLRLIAEQTDAAVAEAAGAGGDAQADLFTSTVKFSRNDPRHNPSE